MIFLPDHVIDHWSFDIYQLLFEEEAVKFAFDRWDAIASCKRNGQPDSVGVYSVKLAATRKPRSITDFPGDR
jgi:hypothetical protein